MNKRKFFGRATLIMVDWILASASIQLLMQSLDWINSSDSLRVNGGFMTLSLSVSCLLLIVLAFHKLWNAPLVVGHDSGQQQEQPQTNQEEKD